MKLVLNCKPTDLYFYIATQPVIYNKNPKNSTYRNTLATENLQHMLIQLLNTHIKKDNSLQLYQTVLNFQLNDIKRKTTLYNFPCLVLSLTENLQDTLFIMQLHKKYKSIQLKSNHIKDIIIICLQSLYKTNS